MACIEPVVNEFACSSSFARLIRRGGAVAGENVENSARQAQPHWLTLQRDDTGNASRAAIREALEAA